MANYLISALHIDTGEIALIQRRNDPMTAIQMWFELSTKYPTCVDIGCKTYEDAKNLLDILQNNKKEIKELNKKYPCPYNLNDILSYGGNAKKSLDTWKHQFDTILPFMMG